MRTSEREALWARLGAASFLTDDEKRAVTRVWSFTEMSVDRLCDLHHVKADWLRVQYEFAALKMQFAAWRYRTALLREERFNPNHDAIGRFTTPSGAVPAGGAGSDTLAGGAGNDQLAQAGGNQNGNTNQLRKYSVNLVEEDAMGGHEFRDHVGKSDAELIEIVESSVVRGTFISLYKDAQGSFLSLESANDITNRLLQSNTARVDAVANGLVAEDWLADRFGFPTGKEAYRSGPEEPAFIRPTYAAGVLIRHDPRSAKGYRVHTSYPVNPRAK